MTFTQIQAPPEQTPEQNPMPFHEIDPDDQPPQQTPDAPYPDPNIPAPTFPLPSELDPASPVRDDPNQID